MGHVIPVSDYAKESAVIVEKSSDYGVGDKVKFNAYYLSIYVGLGSMIDKEAKIVRSASRPIAAASLVAADKPMYVEKYGKQDSYDIVCLFVRFGEDTQLYMVSPLGCDKV